MRKEIAFSVSDNKGIHSGVFSDADLWDYNDLAQELSQNGDINGAFDWIHYNIALTEDIYSISGESLSILVYDISSLDRDNTNFDDDPTRYLLAHPELLIKRYFNFHLIEEED